MFEIYVGDDKVRYILGNNGNKTLVVFGINPSIADKDKADPTISTILNRLETWGYDGFIMLNIYPERATNLGDLKDKLEDELHKENIHKIKECLDGASGILLAWGNQIECRKEFKEYFVEIAEVIKESGIEVYRLGMSKAGHPHHPLARVKKPEKLEKFVDFDKYISKMQTKEE